MAARDLIPIAAKRPLDPMFKAEAEGRASKSPARVRRLLEWTHDIYRY